MRGRFYEPEDVMTYLSDTRHRLAAPTRGRSDDVLARAPAPGEWSPVQILAHLRACSELWGGNIDALVDDDLAALRTNDPRDWLLTVDLVSEGFATSLRRFRRQRSRLLATLDSLTPGEWLRTVTVLTWGQRYPRSILYYADRLARHERSHLRYWDRVLERVETPHD